MRLQQVADHLGAELEGDPAIEIQGVAGIEHASPSHLTFVSNPRYTTHLRFTAAAAVLLAPTTVLPARDSSPAVLRVADPYAAFARAISLFYTAPAYPPGIHPTAVVDPSATLGSGVHLGPYVVVGSNVVIGRDSTLLAHAVLYTGVHVGDRFFAHAHAVVREHCHLGDGVTLGNGAVVGADGFGFAREGGRHWSKIPQSGIAVLGDRVEVQANSCVDRASVGETRIGSGSKIDNLVQVGHGSEVGEDTLLCAQVGLAGSSHIGHRVILAGQVGVAGHCHVGDEVVATAQSGIPGDVAPKSVVSGYPAIENRQWLRAVASFGRLPELLRELRSNREERKTVHPG